MIRNYNKAGQDFDVNGFLKYISKDRFAINEYFKFWKNLFNNLELKEFIPSDRALLKDASDYDKFNQVYFKFGNGAEIDWVGDGCVYSKLSLENCDPEDVSSENFILQKNPLVFLKNDNKWRLLPIASYFQNFDFSFQDLVENIGKKGSSPYSANTFFDDKGYFTFWNNKYKLTDQECEKLELEYLDTLEPTVRLSIKNCDNGINFKIINKEDL